MFKFTLILLGGLIMGCSSSGSNNGSGGNGGYIPPNGSGGSGIVQGDGGILILDSGIAGELIDGSCANKTAEMTPESAAILGIIDTSGSMANTAANS